MTSPRASRRRSGGLAGAILATLIFGAALAKDAPGAEGQYVSLAPVAAPIVLDGQLINYIFVTLQLEVAPGVDVTRLRAREPYFRDALVRAAHRTPFVKPGDYTHLDEAALKRRLMIDCARIAGPGQIVGVKILSVQAQRLTGLPRGPAPPVSAREPIP